MTSFRDPSLGCWEVWSHSDRLLFTCVNQLSFPSQSTVTSTFLCELSACSWRHGGWASGAQRSCLVLPVPPPRRKPSASPPVTPGRSLLCACSCRIHTSSSQSGSSKFPGSCPRSWLLSALSSGPHGISFRLPALSRPPALVSSSQLAHTQGGTCTQTFYPLGRRNQSASPQKFSLRPEAA